MEKIIINAFIDAALITVLGAAMIFILSTSCERDRDRECDNYENSLPWCGR